MVKEQDEKFYEIETGEEVERVIAKMSKSLRNVVNPDDVIAEYGADTLRLYEMYMGPLEASAPWNTRDIVGVHRFLQRVWRLGIDDATGDVHYSLGQEPNAEVERALHATIAKVTDDIPKLAYNTAIASMIEFVNSSTSANALTTGQLDQFLRILSPFAPHIAQEMYSRIGGEGYISTQRWPIFNPSLLVDSVIEMPVQIMGKVRGRITVPADANPKEVEELALNNEHIALLLENVTVRKVIVIQNKIINIVAN